MMRKILVGLGALVGLLLLALVATYLATMPETLPRDAQSHAWLSEGPFEVGLSERTWVDETRATAANGDVPGLPSRTLASNIWYPLDGEGSLPLVVHSHGFVSERSDLAYVAELLASHGYVVVAANFPLTHGGAPGGPNANDLVNQPADVSFIIDSVLQLAGEDKPFAGTLDPSRIGLMGYSLGGITTTLATYHPRLRDDRVAAAISIAGPSAGLTNSFYRTSDVPFMMIAGTLDALINFEYNAAIIPERVSNSMLIGIEGGTHLGFGSIAEPWLRLMDHPDSLGCAAVLANADADPSALIAELGAARDGIVLEDDIPGICEIVPTESALHPARQQSVTSAATLAFFESAFASDVARRQDADSYLRSALQDEFEVVRFSSAATQARTILQEL